MHLFIRKRNSFWERERDMLPFIRRTTHTRLIIIIALGWNFEIPTDTLNHVSTLVSNILKRMQESLAPNQPNDLNVSLEGLALDANVHRPLNLDDDYDRCATNTLEQKLAEKRRPEGFNLWPADRHRVIHHKPAGRDARAICWSILLFLVVRRIRNCCPELSDTAVNRNNAMTWHAHMYMYFYSRYSQPHIARWRRSFLFLALVYASPGNAYCLIS